MEGLIHRLGEGPTPERMAIGGKGWSIDRLARLGLTAPPGFCVTTAAYRASLDASGAATRARALAALLPDQSARRELAGLSCDRPLPPALRSGLSDALAGLRSDPAAGRSLAVRSSAIGEDSGGRSFAGQHLTVLGVAYDQLEGALRRCWESLWSERSVAYRVRMGATFHDQAMAVVVQSMVPAEASAVVFTADPSTGDPDELVVNATRGLGEPLVAGEIEADTARIDRRTLAVRSLEVGRSQRRAWLRASGRVEAEETARDVSQPVLSRFRLTALARLALSAERAIGAPVDVEAACVGRRWYLLQARPMTTAGAAPRPPVGAPA